MSEEELDKSVEDQKSVNTWRSTQFVLRTWQTWLEQSESAEAEKKLIKVYTKQELSRLLKHFYWKIRTAKRNEFEPSSLKTILRGLDRYLQAKKTCKIFHHSCQHAKVKLLENSGKGNKPNAAEKGFKHILLPQFVPLLAVSSAQSKIIFQSSLFAPFFQRLLTCIILFAGHSV